MGAGVRLGGHEVDDHQYGVKNEVYGNVFKNVQSGSLDVEFEDQGEICGNTCTEGNCNVIG